MEDEEKLSIIYTQLQLGAPSAVIRGPKSSCPPQLSSHSTFVISVKDDGRHHVRPSVRLHRGRKKEMRDPKPDESDGENEQRVWAE